LKTADSALLPQVIEWGLLLGEKRTMDLVEARQKIEVIVAEMAAQRRDEGDLVDLRRLLDRMWETRTDRQKFVDADVAFHLRLAEATGNSALRDIQSSIQALLRAWISRVIYASAESSELTYHEHEPILVAVERGDAAAAAAAMEAHMTSAAARLKTALEEASAAGPPAAR
jgi:GntR family transcriptional repressor for pyruvate dehydrogenase complex